MKEIHQKSIPISEKKIKKIKWESMMLEQFINLLNQLGLDCFFKKLSILIKYILYTKQWLFCQITFIFKNPIQ